MTTKPKLAPWQALLNNLSTGLANSSNSRIDLSITTVTVLFLSGAGSNGDLASMLQRVQHRSSQSSRSAAHQRQQPVLSCSGWVLPSELRGDGRCGWPVSPGCANDRHKRVHSGPYSWACQWEPQFAILPASLLVQTHVNEGSRQTQDIGDV